MLDVIKVFIFIFVLTSCGLSDDKNPTSEQEKDDSSSESFYLFQKENISDKHIVSDDFQDFRENAKISATSPALKAASTSDLVVTEKKRLAEEISIVIRKPDGKGKVYKIPTPEAKENLWSFFDEHLEAASDQKANLIVFPKNGVFEIIPPNPTARHLKFEKLENTVVDFNGSTIKLGQISLGLLVEESKRVSFKNGRIVGSGLLVSIGKVVADSSPAGFRFEVLPEYRKALKENYGESPDLRTAGLVQKSDKDTWKLGINKYKEMFLNRKEDVNTFTFESNRQSFVSKSKVETDYPFNNGDHVWLLHQNNGGHAILLKNENGMEDITIEEMEFVNIPGMVIVGEVIRGLHIKNINIKKSDSPLSFYAASSDGIHINANGGDIVVEDSYFGPNGDDKINIKANFWQVTELDKSKRSATIRPVDRNTSVNRWGWKNEKIMFIEKNLKVMGTTQLSNDSNRRNGKKHEVIFKNLPKGVGNGTILANVSNTPARVIVRRNNFFLSRAQAILVQSSHMVISENSFEQIAGPAIKLNFALKDWYESIYPYNISIVGNKFVDSSKSLAKSNELIHFNQYDGLGKEIALITDVRLFGNSLDDLGEKEDSQFPKKNGDPTQKNDEGSDGASEGEKDPAPSSNQNSEDFELIYLNKSSQEISQDIVAQLEFKNISSKNLRTTDLELRYYFDFDGLDPIVDILRSNVPTSRIIARVKNSSTPHLSLHLKGITTIDVGDEIKIRFRIHDRNGQNFDQSNDDSFDASHKKKKLTLKTHVYSSGQKIWGD